MARDPGVGEDRIVVVGVAAGAVVVCGGAVELVPQNILQSDAKIQRAGFLFRSGDHEGHHGINGHWGIVANGNFNSASEPCGLI